MHRVTLLSPVLSRDLLPAEQQAWPAICPAFSYRGGEVSYSPRDATDLTSERRWATTSAHNMQPTLARLRNEGSLPHWQLELAQAAVWLKLGRLDEATNVLGAVACDAEFVRGLGVERSLLGRRELTQSHWLWSLAHVAIESEHAGTVLPQLWAMGLKAQARRDRSLAEQLLVNALQQGRLDVLVALLKWDVHVSVGTSGAIYDHARMRAQAFASKHGPQSHRRAGNAQALQFLRATFKVLGWNTAVLDPPVDEVHATKPCRRMRALWGALSTCTGASPDAPKRGSGVGTQPSR